MKLYQRILIIIVIDAVIYGVGTLINMLLNWPLIYWITNGAIYIVTAFGIAGKGLLNPKYATKMDPRQQAIDQVKDKLIEIVKCFDEAGNKGYGYISDGNAVFFMYLDDKKCVIESTVTINQISHTNAKDFLDKNTDSKKIAIVFDSYPAKSFTPNKGKLIYKSTEVITLALEISRSELIKAVDEATKQLKLNNAHYDFVNKDNISLSIK